MEVATGHFPYPKWSSVFEQLYQVVQGDPPRLTPTHNANTFTAEFVDFVNTWLVSIGDRHTVPYSNTCTFQPNER